MLLNERVLSGWQDLPGALDAAAVSEALNLHTIRNRQWSIFKTSAIKGDGLFEGLDWYNYEIPPFILSFIFLTRSFSGTLMTNTFYKVMNNHL